MKSPDIRQAVSVANWRAVSWSAGWGGAQGMAGEPRKTTSYALSMRSAELAAACQVTAASWPAACCPVRARTMPPAHGDCSRTPRDRASDQTGAR